MSDMTTAIASGLLGLASAALCVLLVFARTKGVWPFANGGEERPSGGTIAYVGFNVFVAMVVAIIGFLRLDLAPIWEVAIVAVLLVLFSYLELLLPSRSRSPWRPWRSTPPLPTAWVCSASSGSWRICP